MTNRQKELVLNGFRAVAADLEAGELPAWLLSCGRALPFYARAAEADSPEAVFLALYNAYGTLLGSRPGVEAMANTLGWEPRRIREILAYIRRDDGDSEFPARKVSLPTAKQLERLKSGFRRLIMADE